jgi:hypothetical protein
MSCATLVMSTSSSISSCCACMHACVCVCGYMCVGICVWVYVCGYMCVGLCLSLCVHTCIRTHTHTHTHTHTQREKRQTHMHTHTVKTLSSMATVVPCSACKYTLRYSPSSGTPSSLSCCCTWLDSVPSSDTSVCPVFALRRSDCLGNRSLFTHVTCVMYLRAVGVSDYSVMSLEWNCFLSSVVLYARERVRV